MSNTTTTTQIQDLPSWMRDPLTRMIATGENLVQEDYPTYQGSRIAPFNVDQLASFAGFRDVPTMGQGMVNQGADFVQNSGTSWADYNNKQGYMNPYMEAAIDPAARRMGEEYQRHMEALRANASANNAFGGSRQALLESNLSRNYLRNNSELYAQGLSDAYDRGMTAFQGDQGRLLSAGSELGGLGQLSQTMGIAGNQALLSSGIQQRAMDQAHVDLAYNDFLEQRNWPYGQLSFFNSLIRGIPQVGTVTTQSQMPEPNTASQILGAGIAGVGLLDKLGGLFD